MALAEAAHEARQYGVDYEFPGWDVVEKVGEPVIVDTLGTAGTASLSISWRDGFYEKH